MSSIFLHSQIVNVENFRVEKDTVGWSGHAVLDLEVQKKANSIFALSNEVRLEFSTKKVYDFL